MLTTLFRSVLFILSLSLVVSLAPIATQAAAAASIRRLTARLIKQPSGNVTRTILQPDGKIIVAGSFEVVSGIVKDDIARLNPNGTVDAAFNAPKLFLGITAVGIQPDGKSSPETLPNPPDSLSRTIGLTSPAGRWMGLLPRRFRIKHRE